MVTKKLMLPIYNTANNMGWRRRRRRRRGERTAMPTRALRSPLPQRTFWEGHIGCTRRSVFAGRIELLGRARSPNSTTVRYVRKAHSGWAGVGWGRGHRN